MSNNWLKRLPEAAVLPNFLWPLARTDRDESWQRFQVDSEEEEDDEDYHKKSKKKRFKSDFIIDEAEVKKGHGAYWPKFAFTEILDRSTEFQMST